MGNGNFCNSYDRFFVHYFNIIFKDGGFSYEEYFREGDVRFFGRILH